MLDRKATPIRPPLKMGTQKRPHVPLKDVKSSNIRAVGHDSKHGELHVSFHSTPDFVYIYPEHDRAAHQSFVTAESKGKHFLQHVRGKAFRKEPISQQLETAA